MAPSTTKRVKCDFPPEVEKSLKDFHTELQGLNDVLDPLLENLNPEVLSKFSPLEQARIDLASAYALNSLFWIYLNCIGEDPKEHGVKQELTRIKDYMMRAKAIEDKAKASRLDKEAVKRFIRGSLWDPNDKNKTDKDNSTRESGPSHSKRKKHS